MKTISNPNTKKYKMPSYSTITSAIAGDTEALDMILKHYEGYIATLSTKTLYDLNGNAYTCVDEELRRRLELKLITKILAFKVSS